MVYYMCIKDVAEKNKSTLMEGEVQKEGKHFCFLIGTRKKVLGFTDVHNKDFHPGSNRIILQVLSF